MAYNPTIWTNDDGTGTVGTPVIASYLNNIEQGIKNNDEQINDLSDERGYLSTKQVIATYTSVNQITTNGFYYLYTVITADTPSGTNGYLVVIGDDEGLYVTQEFIDITSGKRYIRKSFNGTWQPWQQIATTQRALITEYYNSWSPWAGSYHLRLDVIGGRCFCSGILAIGIKDNGTVICTIPEGFRPTVGLEPRFLNGNGHNLQVTIGTNGQILVDTSAQTPWVTTTATLLDFTCSWEV